MQIASLRSVYFPSFALCFNESIKKRKGSLYSIAERRVPELIPVLGSQPAGDVIIDQAVGCHYFPPGLQLPPQPLKGLLSILLRA